MRKALMFSLFIIGTSIASEGGTDSAFMWKVINTIILFALVFIIAKKYIVKYFSNRRKSIETMIEEAKKAKLESEKALQEAKQRLEEANIKYKENIKLAEETAKQEKEAIVNEAKEIAERIKQQAQESVEIEVKKAKAKLKKYAAEKALEASQQLVKQSINPEVNKQIVERTIKQLEA